MGEGGLPPRLGTSGREPLRLPSGVPTTFGEHGEARVVDGDGALQEDLVDQSPLRLSTDGGRTGGTRIRRAARAGAVG